MKGYEGYFFSEIFGLRWSIPKKYCCRLKIKHFCPPKFFGPKKMLG